MTISDTELDAIPEPTDQPDGTSRWYPLRKEVTDQLKAAGIAKPSPQMVETLIRTVRGWRAA